MNKKLKIEKPLDENFGKIIHEIEIYENFFPCYKTMMKK